MAKSKNLYLSLVDKKTKQIKKAASGYFSWGNYSAMRFAEKNNLDPRLVRLARQLQVAQKAGF